MATDESVAGEDVPVKVSPWGALAYRDFQFFWAHGLFQGIARNMRETLTYLLVYQISGSVLQVGLTGVFLGGPAIVFGLIGGALADSTDRKKLLIYTQGITVLSAIGLVVLIFADAVQVWHLWGFTAFWSAVGILGRPAQRAYVPHLVPRSHVMNAITWHSALNQGSGFVGPLMAGFIVATVGMGWAYAVNTAILALALVAVAFIRAPGAPEGSPARASARTIVEGLQFVRKTPVLLSAMVIDTGVMSVGFVRPLLPILALDVYMVGEKGLGVMGSATAAGAILATLVLLRVGNVQRKGAAIVLAYAVYATGLLLLGLAPWFLLALVALALLGFMDVFAFTIKQSLIQIVAPDNFRGRSVALSSILSVTGNSAGAVEMGALASIAGAPGALIINSGVALGMTVVISLRWLGLWRYKD